MSLIDTWCLQHACKICNTTARHKWFHEVNYQVKYFAKANNAFTIFLHKRHGRVIVYQFKTVSLFLNRDSKVTKRIPSSWSSSSSVTSPSSTTRLDSAERSNRPFLSSLVPLFQSESKCQTFHMKMSSACSFFFMQTSHFHKNGFALRLALKQRYKGTRKLPIKRAFPFYR